MSMSSLVLELQQFSFIRDWPEIRKLEILPSEFCLICGDWDELGIRNLARSFLTKCYWMLENARVFTVREILREKQQGGVKLPPPPTQIRVNNWEIWSRVPFWGSLQKLDLPVCQKMPKTKNVWKHPLCMFRKIRVNRQVNLLQGAPKKGFFCHILIPFHLLMQNDLN